MDAANAVPPVEAAYHLTTEPAGAVAVRLATVALPQNDCAEVADGASGEVVIVTVTSNLDSLSNPPAV